MLIDQTIRIFAILSLFIASVCVLGEPSTFCLNDYWGQGVVTPLSEFNGGIANDPTIFAVCGMMALLFLIPFILSYHRGWYFAFFIVFMLIQSILLIAMIDSPSVFGLVYDSVKYCQNYWLLAWVIGQSLFVILSLLFVFHETKN